MNSVNTQKLRTAISTYGEAVVRRALQATLLTKPNDLWAFMAHKCDRLTNPPQNDNGPGHIQHSPSNFPEPHYADSEDVLHEIELHGSDPVDCEQLPASSGKHPFDPEDLKRRYEEARKR